MQVVARRDDDEIRVRVLQHFLLVGRRERELRLLSRLAAAHAVRGADAAERHVLHPLHRRQQHGLGEVPASEEAHADRLRGGEG